MSSSCVFMWAIYIIGHKRQELWTKKETSFSQCITIIGTYIHTYVGELSEKLPTIPITWIEYWVVVTVHSIVVSLFCITSLSIFCEFFYMAAVAIIIIPDFPRKKCNVCFRKKGRIWTLRHGNQHMISINDDDFSREKTAGVLQSASESTALRL